MADVTKINGYDIKDSEARIDINAIYRDYIPNMGNTKSESLTLIRGEGITLKGDEAYGVNLVALDSGDILIQTNTGKAYYKVGNTVGEIATKEYIDSLNANNTQY